MCDICILPCAGCNCRIMIHIGDYCTGRENVHPYCPRCTKKLKKNNPELIKQAKKVFIDNVSCPGPNCSVPGGKKGQEVIILCDDPKAYSIHLNE